MHQSYRIAALLLGGAVFAVAATATAVAQNCEDQLGRTAARHSASTVSASELRIPQKAWRHFEKARAASEAHRDDVFERETSLALAAAPEFAEVYVLHAATQVNARQYEAAIETIATARRMQPQIAWSSVILASALTQLHRYDEAAAETDRAPVAERESWLWKFERTRAEIGRSNVEGALHWSELALAAAPAGCVEAHLLRANAFQIAGRWEDAIGQLEAYLAADGQLTYRAEVMRALERTRETSREDNMRLLAAK